MTMLQRQLQKRLDQPMMKVIEGAAMTGTFAGLCVFITSAAYLALIYGIAHFVPLPQSYFPSTLLVGGLVGAISATVMIHAQRGATKKDHMKSILLRCCMIFIGAYALTITGAPWGIAGSLVASAFIAWTSWLATTMNANWITVK